MCCLGMHEGTGRLFGQLKMEEMEANISMQYFGETPD
jgi:hypothetical protein